MQSIAYDLKGFASGKARQLLKRRKLPVWLWVGNSALSGLVLYLIFLVVVPHIDQLMEPRSHLMAIFAAFTAMTVTNILIAVKVRAAANQSPLWSGHLVMNVTEEGLTLTSEEETLSRKWSAIQDVITKPYGLMIISKGYVVMPIPTKAFASPAEMEAFADALRARILPAKEAA